MLCCYCSGIIGEGGLLINNNSLLEVCKPGISKKAAHANIRAYPFSFSELLVHQMANVHIDEDIYCYALQQGTGLQYISYDVPFGWTEFTEIYSGSLNSMIIH